MGRALFRGDIGLGVCCSRLRAGEPHEWAKNTVLSALFSAASRQFALVHISSQSANYGPILHKIKQIEK